MELIEHLESYLRPIASGSSGDETTPEGVQVARFGPDVPFSGVTTFVTLGLSRHHLELPGGDSVHQELLMHVPEEGRPGLANGLLFQLAGEMVRRRSALWRGAIIGPRGPIFPGGTATAMVAISPRYLPESFELCHSGAVPIVLTWLLPITTGEAEMVRRDGWEALEQAFVVQDPDLTDLYRAGVS